jgi:hypothetical protein
MLHDKELRQALMGLGRKRGASKYNAKPTYSKDGYRFDSKREHERYEQLRLMEKAGQINNLTIHPLYPIKWPTDGSPICIVELDFDYSDINGTAHHEDVKGADTALSKLKRKLVEAAYHFKVELIKK